MVSLRPGEILGLLGQNGSGKTALLRRLAAEWPGAQLLEMAAHPSASSRLAALHQAVESGDEPLLVDEPTLGLDGGRARMACRLLREAASARSVGIATCNPQLVRELCRRVGIVREGRVTQEGETALLLQPYGYLIEVRDRLDDHWGELFDGFQLIPGLRRTQLLKEPCDQASLQGALHQIRKLGLRLIAVTPTFADFERSSHH